MSFAPRALAAGSPLLSDLEAPSLPITPTLSGPPVTPEQRIYFYSPDEWERFIREWATALNEDYAQIKRIGGSGDRGVDVAAFKTRHGYEGSWDCYQGKHYESALVPTDAWPEITKIFVNVIAGYYTMPDRYAFLAPQGCGPTLNRALSRPTSLKEQYLAVLDTNIACVAALSGEVLENVRELARTTDFARFQSVELEDALETHRKTPYYAARFGGPLPIRPPTGAPPESPREHESRYVSKLADVYREQNPPDEIDETSLSSHPTFGAHFRRQRVAFYSAEALRMYARDSVPDGTFEALQDDLHSGVVEVLDADHRSGRERLQAVLTQSAQIDLSSHALIAVARINDRKGICHQLANEDRLTWTRPAS